MKKILSLIALLVVTFTAFAETTSEKIIPDGTQPNGGTITPKAITVDWATQKIVANVDLTNCLTGTNEQIFAISTNSADIANWDQESGSTLHFFYRQNFTDWGLQLPMFTSSLFSIAIKAITALPTVSTR